MATQKRKYLTIIMTNITDYHTVERIAYFNVVIKNVTRENADILLTASKSSTSGKTLPNVTTS